MSVFGASLVQKNRHAAHQHWPRRSLALLDRRTTFCRDELAGFDDEQQLCGVAHRLEAARLLPEGGGADHLSMMTEPHVGTLVQVLGENMT